jgi:hypothetical protein
LTIISPNERTKATRKIPPKLSSATGARQFRAKEGRAIRKEIPKIAQRDAKLMIKTKMQGSYEVLARISQTR